MHDNGVRSLCSAAQVLAAGGADKREVSHGV